MTITHRMEMNSEIMLGKPVIRETRIPVERIFCKHGEGASEADLCDAYPGFTPEDIRAAAVLAADVLAHMETILLEPSDITAAG
ncbi:DUF433 domain-containing protein [Desulfosoma caldarium]|uniref:Uncharacterized protein (DUF433 family) n=1 Tax=Desulfosoma caldarium TaxID=610254 RepID=A0A3N1UMK7_9BACT|nr:DUF433 domain-containing protein [Desulfosoma caldarium]ROQ90978.1 uncharacterized protein (DUF433 family) [Desulfosoma caldarium]